MNPIIVSIALIGGFTVLFLTVSDDDTPVKNHTNEPKSPDLAIESKQKDYVSIKYTQTPSVAKINNVIKDNKEEKEKRNYLIAEEKSANNTYGLKLYSSSIRSEKVLGRIYIQGFIGNEKFNIDLPSSAKNNASLIVTDNFTNISYKAKIKFDKLRNEKTYDISFEFNQAEEIIAEEIERLNSIPNPFN